MRLVWILFAWICSTPAHAAGLSAAFDSANKLYEQGKFGEAVAAYGSMVQSGRVSPALYFNLGNAWFKSGQIGRTLAAYRQAQRLAPRDPDLRANLQFVRNQVQGPTLLPNRWQRLLNRLTVNEWTGLASLGLWLWLLSLALGLLRPALKPSLRTFALGSGLGAAAMCLCLGLALLANRAQSAIVIAHDAAVRTGPLEESQTAFTAHDGAELTVLDQKDDWLQVSAGDRRIGWLKREQVVVWPSGIPGSGAPGPGV